MAKRRTSEELQIAELTKTIAELTNALEIANAEIEKLWAVVERDRQRVLAETAHFTAKRADSGEVPPETPSQ